MHIVGDTAYYNRIKNQEYTLMHGADKICTTKYVVTSCSAQWQTLHTTICSTVPPYSAQYAVLSYSVQRETQSDTVYLCCTIKQCVVGETAYYNMFYII